MNRARLVTVVLMLGLLNACSGMAQMQGPVAKLSEGAHSAASSETAFLKAVETLDCNSQFYAHARDWAMGTVSTVDLTGACRPTLITGEQIRIRQQLMEAVVLYADKMLALAVNDDNKTLDANAQKLAKNLNAVAKQSGFSELSAASAVEAAILAVAEMALDQRRFTGLKDAALSMAPSLETLVAVLKTENAGFAEGMESKRDLVEISLKEILVKTHRQQVATSFLDVVEMRNILRMANPFGAAPVSSSLPQPALDPLRVAEQLNATLDSIVNVNNAIAHAGTGGVMAAANDLAARAKAAQANQEAFANP